MASSGVIKSVTSDVKAIAVDGTERLLHVGDTVLLNETIITGDAGVVSIWLSDGTKLGLEQNSNTVLNDDVFNQGLTESLKSPISSAAEDEVAAIQQALANDESFDPSKLEAPAAGGVTGTEDTGGGGGGHSAVAIDYLNPARTPDSGFNTIGINNGDQVFLDLTSQELILEPGIAQAPVIGINSIIDGREAVSIVNYQIASGNVLANTINLDGSSSVINFTVDNQTTTAGSSITIVNVGDLFIDTDGEYTFTPDANFSGTVPNIDYTVVDDSDATDTVVSGLDITVRPGPAVQVTDHNGLNVGDNEVVESSTTAVTGDFVLTSSEGVLSIAVDGTSISEAELLASSTSPIAITTVEGGMLSIVSYEASSGTVNYSYLPASGAKDHSNGGDSIVDQLEITMTDVNNVTSVPGILDILITDTVPQAFDNVEKLSQDQVWLVDNVISNARNGNDTAADDLIGVDGGGKLTSVTHGSDTRSFLDAGDLVNIGGDDLIQFDTNNGTLYIREDGQYWYQNTTLGGNTEVTDTFSYQLVDSDFGANNSASMSTADLTITQVLGDINTGDTTV